MDDRAQQPTRPWRTLGDPEPPPNVDAGRGPSLIALVLGVGATIALAAIAFVAATSASDGGTVRVEGADLASDMAPGAVTPTATADAPLVVDVGGAVGRPGVYRLPGGARVGDAIAAAGGFGPRVDTVRASAELNLAAILADGDRIRVPSRDDPTAAPGQGPPTDGTASGGTDGGDAGTSGGTGLIDLNRATAAELDALPGIGPVLAGRIVESREEQRFGSVDDLRERGILGAATFEKVRLLVVVR
ncbi:MAG: ComEA family DNA-binding protein [Chloroflexota bacterium]